MAALNIDLILEEYLSDVLGKLQDRACCSNAKEQFGLPM